jgi:Phage Tail Collar Domain
MVPEVADAIPASVLTSPIIGEARRFDGATAPGNWVLIQGQTLNVADYQPLFRVLGSIAGGNGKTTFKLPAVKVGWIVAVAGTFPSSPAALQRLGRHMTPQDSLGEGAHPSMGRVLPTRLRMIADQRQAAILQSQRLAASAIRAGSGRALPLSPDVQARIDRVSEDARAASLAQLSPQNRGRLENLVEGILANRVSVYQATLQMTESLSAEEARAQLDVFDSAQRQVRSGWAGMVHENPQVEAGRYVISAAFTGERLNTLRSMNASE